MKQALSITISGRVQGVGFRFSAVNKAQALGLKGFVKNNRDGTVYIEAEGPPENLQELVQWCWQGPPSARVEHVSHQEIPVRDYARFGVK